MRGAAESVTTHPRVWDRDAGPDGGWVEIQPAPATNSGFQEARSFVLAYPEANECMFLVDDEPLERDQGHVQAWVWNPRFYAGEVTAELRGPDGRVVERYLLDVAPNPSKTGRAAFEAMIQELWAEDPLLVTGSEPATRRIGTLDALQDPLLELARLRRHAPAFVQSLEAVQRRPRHALIRRREFSALHRVRHVDRQTAAAAARHRDLVELLARGVSSGSLRMTTLDVPRVEETLDCAANRCLAALVGEVSRRTASLLGRLQVVVDKEKQSDTRTPLASRWPARRAFLEGLMARLSRIRKHPPLSDVGHEEITASGLNAISGDPLYARAWAKGWRAIRTGVAGPQIEERLWISPTWEVFERWCFVKLGALLRVALPGFAWERGTHHPAGATAFWRGVCDDLWVELLLQPVFPSECPTKRHEFWSISQERIPDIVVTMRRGDDKSFLVLDAKYRASRVGVLDAMTSAHVYQDSLRWGERRPVATLLLLPNGGGAPWLEDPGSKNPIE